MCFQVGLRCDSQLIENVDRRVALDEFISGGAQLRGIDVSADAVVSGKGRKWLFFKVLAPNLSRAIRSKVKGGGKLREVDVGASIHRLVAADLDSKIACIEAAHKRHQGCAAGAVRCDGAMQMVHKRRDTTALLVLVRLGQSSPFAHPGARPTLQGG